MNVTFSNEHEHITDSLAFKIIYGIFYTFGELISSIGYIGFVYFEIYGGDPMKRSMKNKLMAQAYFMALVFWLSNTGFAWRIIIGPLNEEITVIESGRKNLQTSKLLSSNIST